MSCDTSDPKILEAYHDLQSNTETDWLLLSYLPIAPNHDVVLDKTGSGGVAGLRNAIGSSDEEVLFGLVRLQGHELLVTFVSESVVGVRRARTIVHSRAIAKLFPDHHSTLTISHASELSDSATTERLNLDEAHLQQVRAHHRAVSNGSTIRSRVGADEGVSTHPSNRSLKTDHQEVLHGDELPPLPAPSPPRSPVPAPVAGPAAAVPTAGLASMELGPPITSHPRAVSHSQAPPLHHPSPIQIDQRRVVSSSALPPSPTTPNSSRFKNMIPKFARRRRRSSSSQTGSQPGSIPNSPIPSQNGFATQSANYPAPPVPPKEPPASVSTGFVPPMNRQAFPSHPASNTASEEAQAAEALHSVRERSISIEKETQDRFRREKLGYGHPSAAAGVSQDRQVSMDTESEGGGLPYDRDDHVPAAAEQQGLSTLTEVTSSTSLSREAADAAAAEKLAAAAEAHAERVAAEREREEVELKREAEERDRLERERVEELERIEREAAAERQRVVAAEAAEAERIRVEEERVRFEEAERVRLQAEKEERERVEKEERERAEAQVRLLALEQAEEKKRKVTESLENQFRQGGTLLSGWITVQSPNSMAWRRRWFKLQPTVLELFKVETDPSPIGTIPLNPSTSLSIWYEESQVKDSFKLSCSDGLDYFLFADSKEDLDVVKEGLGVTGISVNRRE